MSLKFKYNKTDLQRLTKELKIRIDLLPTLKAKEAALRAEVKRAHNAVTAIKEKITQKQSSASKTFRLWSELPALIKEVKVSLEVRRVAGTKIPALGSVIFEAENYSLFSSPSWFPLGIETLKAAVTLNIELLIAEQKMRILEHARRKTTQKVNLYEKVQIPDYEESIRKVKRFLEDEENLSTSAQKILKARILAAEEAT